MLESHIAEAVRRSDRRILVTGASGWLGSATLDLLHEALGSHFQERVLCFGSSHKRLRVGNCDAVEQRPLVELSGLPEEPSLLLHFAFLTKDRAEQMDQAAYRAANGAIRECVIGSLDKIGVRSLLVASSGAAAFADDPRASEAMRLYGSLKRDDEDAFAAWGQSSSRRAVLARIYNLSGPHINKLGSYALASFIMDALAGGPIVVRALHAVVRGYVAIRELMSLAFALLLDESPGVIRFDSGGEPVELGVLAERVAEHLRGCAVTRPARADGLDRYLGDDAAYGRLLQAQQIDRVPLTAQIAETAGFLAGPQAA